MTNDEKIKKANELIKEVLINEIELDNVNDSSLLIIDDDVYKYLVNFWYTNLETEIFVTEDGEFEIDEYLNVEEIKLK